MSIHRIIVAGCGAMSNTWFDYVAQRENAEIVGVVDVNPDAAKVMVNQKGLAVPTFTDLSEAIMKADANLVFDVTIPAAHKQIVTTALKAGCNVFGEKPMAETLDDAKEVLHVAQKTGKTYSVMQNRRYLNQIRTFQKLLSEGTIGEIGSIHADFFLGPNFGGFRDMMDHPLIVDMAIHTFDQARFLTGADPVSVYCQEYNPKGSWYEGDSSAICIFEMNDGSLFSYRGSWSAIGHQTSWESNWRVTGSKGSVHWDGLQPPVCEVVDEAKPVEFLTPTKVLTSQHEETIREGHWGCLDEMFLALEEGRPAETDCSDNIKSMEMVFGAMKSSKTGMKISLI